MFSVKGQWPAGLTLAATAVAVIAVGGWSLGMTAGSLGAFEAFHLVTAVAASFISGALCWRMTDGARTVQERWAYLTLSAVGMAFTVQAIPYILWGFVTWILGAFVVHSIFFGIEAVIAVAIWSLALSLLNRARIGDGARWSGPSRGVIVWSLVGIVVVLIPIIFVVREFA